MGIPSWGSKVLPIWVMIVGALIAACGESDSNGDADGQSAHGSGDGQVAADGHVMVADRVIYEPGTRRFRFSIRTDAGRPVRDFEIAHEKRMHLIVVSRDLSSYQHVHPRLDQDGTWSVRLRLPRAGTYRAVADFNTGSNHVLGADLFVNGRSLAKPLPRPASSARVDGYQVYLSGVSSQAGKDVSIAFTVLRNGQPVVDLQEYLGARGHLVALREGDLSYLHVHPESTDADDDGIIPFTGSFPSSGRYRLFMQFRHRDRVHTAPFTVAIGGRGGGTDEAPAETEGGEDHEHH